MSGGIIAVSQIVHIFRHFNETISCPFLQYDVNSDTHKFRLTERSNGLIFRASSVCDVAAKFANKLK